MFCSYNVPGVAIGLGCNDEQNMSSCPQGACSQTLIVCVLPVQLGNGLLSRIPMKDHQYLIITVHPFVVFFLAPLPTHYLDSSSLYLACFRVPLLPASSASASEPHQPAESPNGLFSIVCSLLQSLIHPPNRAQTRYYPKQTPQHSP